MALSYWAVRPVSQPGTVRIEKAETAREACRLAYGRGIRPGSWEAKNMGPRVAVIQSDLKRITLLQDPQGWEPIL
jgi:hypothetical protein